MLGRLQNFINREDEYSPKLSVRNSVQRVYNSISDKLGDRSWFKELSQYYRGMGWEEFWVRYTLGRMEQDKRWSEKERTSESAIRDYYSSTDYFLLRQVYFRRKDSFHHVLKYLKKKDAALCEYGCGIAPATSWLSQRLPSSVQFTGVDIPCPTFEFAKWRNRKRKNVEFISPPLGSHYPLTKNYDVILCHDVFEHLPNPYEVAEHLIAHLKAGGILMCDFVYAPGGANLETSAKLREKTLKLLESELEPVIPIDPKKQGAEFGLYRKRLTN